jgi:hypothetical protein
MEFSLSAFFKVYNSELRLNTESLRQRNTCSGNKRLGPPLLSILQSGAKRKTYSWNETARSYVTGLYTQHKNITINYDKSQAVHICHIDRQSILHSSLVQNRPTSRLSLTVIILTTVRMTQLFAKELLYEKM